MEKLLKKKFVRTLLIVYALSYLMHDFFFVNFAHAEDPIQNTNLVAVIVDKRLYDNNAIENKIRRYATDYIQQKISDSKAIVLPINIENFKAHDIVKMLENMYFDGIKDAPSKLVGLVLVGDIPLPVVEYNSFIYPSIYPYVDFEDQQFVYNADKEYFSYNNNPNAQAEIRHGIIKFKGTNTTDEINKYERFFDKLQNYNNVQTDNDTGTQFVATKIRYDDLVATKEYFLTDNITYYVNNFLFTEDVGYRRFTNALLETLKGEHTKVVSDATDALTSGLNNLIPNNPDADEQAAADFGGTIQTLMDQFNQIMGNMGSSSSSNNQQQQQNQSTTPVTKSPTLMLKAMTQEFLKGYDTLLGTKYLTRLRDNVKAPARRYQTDADGNLTLNFDSLYNKIVLNDTWAAGNLEQGISPLLIQFNNTLEEALSGKIADEGYYMEIPIMTGYYDRTDQTKKPSRYALYENFYFGEKASEINSAQEFSAYRGTYGDLQNGGSLSGVTFSGASKTIGGSYKVFSQQIEANRGYNLRNAEADLEKFTPREGKKRFAASTYDGQALVNAWKLKKNVWKEKNKKSRYNILTQDTEEGSSEGGQDVINKNRGGATPLNLDNNSKLKYYSYKDARQPIYDIAGSDVISGAQAAANSYLGSTTYKSVFKTKIDNGSRAYIYPRALLMVGDEAEADEGGATDQATLETTTEGSQIAFVHKLPGTYSDYFSIYPNFGNSSSGYQYLYKKIDSRVFNISPTPEQINGIITSSYGPGSEPEKLYTKIVLEINAAKVGLENKEAESDAGIDALQSGINSLDIASIMNFNVSGYTGNLNTLANTRSQTITASGHNAITGAIQQAENGLESIDSFLIASRTDKEYYNHRGNNLLSSETEYTTSLSIAGALDVIEEYQANNGIRQGFFTLLTGTVKLLSGQIDIITGRIAALENTFNGVSSWKNTSQSNLNALVTSISGKIADLNSKRNSINQLQTSSPPPPISYIGCSSTYAALCTAIITVRNKLSSINAELQNVLASKSKSYAKEEYRDKLIPPITPVRYSATTLSRNNTRFGRIDFGINYHSNLSNPGLKSEIQNLRTYVNAFTRIDALSPTDVRKSGGMDMTTRERPIDNIRNVTFQGVGGGLVKFNYPNLYEIETFKTDGDKLVLKPVDEIAQSIKSYLTGKVKEYNDLLTIEQNNKNNFYTPHAAAFNALGGLANPNRTYNLMNENFFIDTLGTTLDEIPDKAVETIAKLMYYQNITRQEKQPQTGILADINETKSSFDINKKTAYIMQNYLSGNNDQGPLITPTYSTGGYEVAFINSDSQDYIKAKPTPTDIKEIQVIQESKKNTYQQQAPAEDGPIADACNFDPSGSELIFDVKTLGSPWLKAIKCRFTETMKDPFKIKVDYGNAMGPTLQNFVGEVNQSVENRQGSVGQYASQRGALDTETSNQETIANSTAEQQATLNDINTYAEFRLSSSGQDQATARQLGNQTLGKQLKIWSSRDIGTLDIGIQATGDNCLAIVNKTNNLCQKNINTINPFTSPQEYTIYFKDNTAGTTVVTVEFCLKNTNKCIKKASKIEILADPLKKATIKTASKEVIAGGEVPLSIEGEDQYGNRLGLIAPEAMLYATTGEGQVRNGGTTSSQLTFSDFNKATLSYIAPSEVANDAERQTTIHFSGLSLQAGNRVAVATGYAMTVVKGFLDIYYQSHKIFEHNNIDSIEPMVVDLDGKQNILYTGNDNKIHIERNLVPKIILSLKDKDGIPLTRVKSIALISTQNKLLMPGEITGDTFVNNGSFIISGGMLDIYLYPSFQAGEDMLYISIPGIDPIKIPVTVNGGTPQKVSVTLDKETATPGETIQAKIKITDLRDNPISEATDLKIGTLGALTIDGGDTKTISATGENMIELETTEPGGESFMTAKISNLALDKQTPGYKDILVQNTLLPETGLNVMYLNLFGTDRGNQWGYFSDKMGYANRLMDQSDKLLAVTTQLMDPNKLRSTDVIVTENGQVKNLADKEISLQIIDKDFVVKITDIGTIDIGKTNDFSLEKIDDTSTIQQVIAGKNIVAYLPEPTDSIIEKNETNGKKILINDEEILNLNNGTIADGVTMVLSTDKVENLSKRDIAMGDKKIGQLILARNDDTDILDNRDTNTTISNPDYDQQKVFAESSTNGSMGIGLYQVNSSFSKEGYKSIEDNSDSTLGLGFTNDFKNVTYFGNGKSVGESTMPFGSQFLVNFGDPLLKKVSPNVNIKANANITTDFDGGLGEIIYSDPTKPIFKVVPIDFNDDGLDDLAVVYQDGTIKLMKNYGGNTPYSDLQALTTIADSIKEVIVGDVDGNGYQDIVIRTNNNKVKVYTNKKGVFDVDGSLACLNTNVKPGYRSNVPDDMSQATQIFFEDMDDDGKLDIVTNDNRGDIKIFYGGSSSDGANYLSTLKYTCDDGRYERQKDHMKIVRSLGMKIDENLYIQNASVIHRKGLTGSSETETTTGDEGSAASDAFAGGTLDGWSNSDPSQADQNELEQLNAQGNTMVGEATGQAEGFVNNLDAYISEGLQSYTKYISSPIDYVPTYENEDLAKELILYAQAFSLSGDDAATVYKTYEDLNGDILEPGDQVLVKTTIGALKKSTFTYLENMQLPGNSQIEADDNGKILSFQFATGTDTGDIMINRNVDDTYEFMLDNIDLNAGDRLEFSYIFTYLGTPGMKIDVKDDEVMTSDLAYTYTQSVQSGNVITQTLLNTKQKDKLPDIILYPSNSCKKYKLTLFNRQTDKKKYDDIFFNVQQKIDEENAALQQQTQANISETNAATQPTSLEGIQDLPGMDTVLESRNTQSIFADAGQGGGASLGLDTSVIDQSTAGIQKKMDSSLNGACQGFSIGKNNSCQGVPVPFNQAFLAPGSYHIFGCKKIPMGKLEDGLPAIAFPTNGTIPIRPPIPAGAGGIFGGTTSQVRVYVVPTMTLGVGIAICLGPQPLGNTLPKPFRDIAGNCVVFAIPPVTQCEDTSNNGGESDQVLNEFYVNAAQNGVCENPPKPAHNVIVFTSNTSYDGTNVIGTDNDTSSESPLVTLRGGDITPAGENYNYPAPDTWEGNFFGLSLDQKPVKVKNLPSAGQAGSSRSPNATFDFGGGEKFTLDMGQKVTLKQLSSISKGLIKCIVKDRVDKQVMFLLNNMTKLTVNIAFPDLSQLGEGWGQLSLENLNKILKKDNAADINNGNNQALSLSGQGIIGGAKEIFSKQTYQNATNQTSNPFDAIMTMFKEVPLINMNTKDIDIKIPMIGSEDITKYVAYLKARYETNAKILERRISMVNNVLAFCGQTSKTEAKQALIDLPKEKADILADQSLTATDKASMANNIDQEILNMSGIANKPGPGTGRQIFGEDIQYLPENLNLAFRKISQIPRLEALKLGLTTKKAANKIAGTFTEQEQARLDAIQARLDKVNKCGDFIKGIGGFLKFYENTAGLIKSIKQNIKILDQYKTFPLQLYERLHVVDRYLTEITSVFSDFLGSIMYRMKTNADRFSKYVDAIILIVGVMKTRQVLIDFSVNRSKKCGKCTNDDYSPQSCSLGFLCPKIPVLKIPNFRIPNLYIDLSHLSLGIDITMPNFNFKPMAVTLPKIPNLPEPPKVEIFLEYNYGIDMDMGFFKNLNLPTIPILPSPPQLPELPSFIPNVKITLPVIPPAPKVPKISPKIELSIKIAEFIAKIYCIIKGGIGLVGEKGVKGKVEQMTQRTRNVPIFDYFDISAKLREKPMEGFDYKLDAYLELKYNFDGFYSFLNNVVQPINELSNMVEGVTQKSIDTAQEQINNNEVTDRFNDVENFQIEDLNSYIPEDTGRMLEYGAAYADIQKGLAIFKNKADEKNDTKTLQTLNKIEAETETKSNISPAYKELENARYQAEEIIKNKQKETQKLAEQIQDDYDGFIKSMKGSTNTLVKGEDFSTTISAPLFNADKSTKNYLQKQENPSETYMKLNKTVLDGYMKALDSQTPEQLNMTETTYNKSKAYLQEIDKKIQKATPLIAYNVSTSDTPETVKKEAPKVLLAQNTNPPCLTCGTGTSAASYSADLSQFVRGVFVQVYSGDEKLMVNTVKSEENVMRIGQNYLQFDINDDGDHDNNNLNDDKDDIIMRDEGNIYIKYANQENIYEDDNYSNDYYVHEIDSPDDLRDNDKIEVRDDGYVDIGDITLKLADETQEVKNFKMQGQDFESISFGWMNSGLMGDKPDAYLIKLNQRIDTFNDKNESDTYGLDDEEFNKKYVLVLPEGTDTGGLISLKDGFPDKHPIASLITGDSSDAGTIVAVKFYDPSQEKITISLQEIPRTRQYAQIATLTKHQEKLSQSQAEKFGLYEITSTRSNQIVAGRQLIGDSVGPVGEFTLYRPQINEVVGTGTTFEGFVSTHYIIKANRKDNVAVQTMRIEKDGEIIAIDTGSAETGSIQLPSGLFYTGETEENRYFGAQDFNGNVTREQINLNVKIPEIEIIDTNQMNDENTQVIAQISNDLDEGNVLFQRERNSIRNIMTGANGTSYFPLTGKQTIITGGVFSIGNTIGFYNMQGQEVGTLNPNNGRISVSSGFQSIIKVQLDLSSHMPLIKIFDTTSNSTLFQVNLPTENLVDITMHQGAPNYEKTYLDETTFGIFNEGYCIKAQNDNCIIFVGPEGQVYIPTPYNNSLEGNYEFDTANSTILYHIKDQSSNQIATISVKFKVQK